MIHLPIEIYNVLNEKSNFDYLFLSHLSTHRNAWDAYDAAVEKMQSYAEKWKHSCDDYDTYRVKLHYRSFHVTGFRDFIGTNAKSGDIPVPKHIVDAVTGGFEIFLDTFYIVNKHSQMAYNKALIEINKYLPDWKPAKNYASYKSLQGYRRKVKKVTNKKR